MMSDIDPKSYNSNALHYISKNMTMIERVGSELKVSPDAIAASMAREITRTDKKSVISTVAHYISRNLARYAFESTLETQYQADKQKLNQNQGIFDGSYSTTRQFSNHLLADVGSGSIKILTAFQIIEQYTKAPEGKLLGLDRYNMNDLHSIVEDLVNSKNSLSVKIAALVVLNGQKFFHGKSIAGIPWNELSEEQKTAALTAYYSAGENAVRKDMQENKFFPFGTGANNGQVGGWVTYDQNFQNLQSILSNRKAPAISVAPKPVRKKAATQSASAFPHTEISDFHAGIMNATSGLVALRIKRDTKEAIENLLAPARAGLKREIAVSLAGARELSNGLISVSRAGVSISPILGVHRNRLNNNPAVVPLAPFHMAVRFDLRCSATLPSFAPVRKAGGIAGALDSNHVAASINSLTLGGDTASSVMAAPAIRPQMDQWQFSEMLSRELDHQARLPPSGATGFDPRLSPAWPGMKLPN